MSVGNPPFEAHWLGRIPYTEAYAKQRALHARRVDNSIPDQLLLLEHPPVLTVPRRSDQKNLLVSQKDLAERGIEIIPTDRGGEITLHNPGQLVGYLICDLSSRGKDLHAFLRWIESCLETIASTFGVVTEKKEGLTGLWVEDRKLASIGIAVKRWVSLHGFALNASNDLSQFELIHPCGLEEIEMTSLAKETGKNIEWEILLNGTRNAFGAEEGIFREKIATPSGSRS